MRIRQLRPGDSIPNGTPRRYPNRSSGYVRLRWRVGKGEYVEAYEHRVVGDRVTTAPHVHHRNRNRADNAADNLIPLTPAEHGREHRTWDRDRAARLYRDGQSTTRIAKRLGVNAATVYRGLIGEGVPIRTDQPPHNRIDLDEAQIREWHANGKRAKAIAAELGVSPVVIYQRFRELGLRPFPPGRPTR